MYFTEIKKKFVRFSTSQKDNKTSIKIKNKVDFDLSKNRKVSV